MLDIRGGDPRLDFGLFLIRQPACARRTIGQRQQRDEAEQTGRQSLDDVEPLPAVQAVEDRHG